MATGQPRDLLPQPEPLPMPKDGGAMTDGELLGCFASSRDNAAFEALVRRHGPMVLGVCRRVLQHAQDAEDAFQATFLVLARKAPSVRQRELVGNWLYGVAHRIALSARAAAGRRRARECEVNPMPEPPAQVPADSLPELRRILDEEVSRLPDKYRVPVVLCELEGRTLRDVAQQLGIPVGTLSGRLTTARRTLGRRLARRGNLALAGGALTAVLAESATAGIPAPLIARAVESAKAATVSTHVAALADAAIKTMLLTKLKLAAVVALAVIAAGAAIVALSTSRSERAAGEPRVFKLDGRGRRVAWSPDGQTLVVDEIYEPLIFGRKGSAVQLWDVPTGQLRKTLASAPGGGLAFQQVVFSPDGKTIAATVSEEIVQPEMRQIRSVVKLWNTRTLEVERTLDHDVHLVGVAFSPDGKRLAATNPSQNLVRVWNAETGALERTIDTGQAQPWSLSFAPDGRSLVVSGSYSDRSGEATIWDPDTGHLRRRLKQASPVTLVAWSSDARTIATAGELVQLWDVDKGEPIATLSGDRHYKRSIAISPDGRILATAGSDSLIRLWDARTGELIKTLKGHDGEVYAVAFSPDGKTLASVSQDQTARLWPISSPQTGSK
jgi:RNA polymerase sigma factor (sigma-70 family)